MIAIKPRETFVCLSESKIDFYSIWFKVGTFRYQITNIIESLVSTKKS